MIAKSFEYLRSQMVEHQIVARGVHDERVLEALRTVPRERFVSEPMGEFVYEDLPLPIEEGQTISQPYIVALMIAALELGPDDAVLEVGAGSGYATAVLSRIVKNVYAIERFETLASLARDRMRNLGYDNVRVICGDGTRGLPERAPYNAILVSAGGPEIPQPLLDQLVVGGRLLIPVGAELRTQELMRVRRTGPHTFEEETIGRVRFVPLIGSEGWASDDAAEKGLVPTEPPRVRSTIRRRLCGLISEHAEPVDSIETADLSGLMDRIGDARVVLIGEATHGTSEFYRMRARITEELVRARGFTNVAIEGDWPDVNAIDRHVRGRGRAYLRTPAFSRFPVWMWCNTETRGFVDGLAEFNKDRTEEDKVGVHGLDLYSLNNSIGAVLEYLDRVDPGSAKIARTRYACFSPWEMDPATYGRAALAGRMETCETEVIDTLTDLLNKRLEYLHTDGEEFFDAERNATVIREAERYYRVMYYGSRDSWNLRDRHMFDTLLAVMEHRGPESKAVVWAHNSHIGNAAATEMGTRGEFNIGQLARERFGDRAYAIGFGTDHGTVAAAENWNEPMERMSVRPSHEGSYESLCHGAAPGAFLLPLRTPRGADLRNELLQPRLERAIGVIYRPETELLSHYFQAVLPRQFDEYAWFDETSAVHPIQTHELAGVPETYPFGL